MWHQCQRQRWRWLWEHIACNSVVTDCEKECANRYKHTLKWNHSVESVVVVDNNQKQNTHQTIKCNQSLNLDVKPNGRIAHFVLWARTIRFFLSISFNFISFYLSVFLARCRLALPFALCVREREIERWWLLFHFNMIIIIVERAIERQ